MGKGSDAKTDELTREEVARHDKKGDMWIIINNKVYDISSFRHPGGAVITTYAGQDASEAFVALHPEMDSAYKYFPDLCVGPLVDSGKSKPAPLVAEFRKLRADFEREGLFRSDWRFFVAHLAHILLLEAVAWWVLAAATGPAVPGAPGNVHPAAAGVSRLGWWLRAAVGMACLVTCQIQIGWLQHDLGHLSVLKSNILNRIGHWFVLCHLKGASASWWNGRHFRHHAKPNVLYKDFDMLSDPLFVWGANMPRLGFGWRFTPYQPYYWWIAGPPTVVTALFHFENLRTLFKHRKFFELAVMSTAYLRFFFFAGSILGWRDALILYSVMRLLESHWFTWVTSMNHLPMEMTYDENNDWVTQQLKSTQNVTPSFFNDWFCGGLNYQIEYHLFPCMPRHNYRAASARVRELVERHGLKYQVKPMLQACKDIYRALTSASESWMREQQARKAAHVQ